MKLKAPPFAADAPCLKGACEEALDALDLAASLTEAVVEAEGETDKPSLRGFVFGIASEADELATSASRAGAVACAAMFSISPKRASGMLGYADLE